MKDLIEKTNSLSIIEKNNQNIDFLLLELLKTYEETQIISFYQSKNHYEMITAGLDTQTSIQTIFESNQFTFNNEICIIDDYHSAKNYIQQFEKNCKKVVRIYRSNTFQDCDMYLSDINISVDALPIGNSALLDGIITIFDREQTYAAYKYKIKAKNVHFYS
ncbi:hypothetical protein BDAP_002784 [Binucleata daphniae]